MTDPIHMTEDEKREAIRAQIAIVQSGDPANVERANAELARLTVQPPRPHRKDRE